LDDYDDRIQQVLVKYAAAYPFDWTARFNLKRERFNLGELMMKLRQFRRNKWFEILGFRICYPQGFICPLDSFRSIGNIFVDTLDSLFDTSKYGRIITKHARSVPKNRYENCKNHMNFINDKKG
jgi:hypothetical protein